MQIRVALLGFGNVGRALAGLLMKKATEIKSIYDLDICVTGILTLHHGAAVDHKGIDLARALTVDNLDRLNTCAQVSDALNFIKVSQAHVLFENTPVNYLDGMPAVDYLRFALENGMHAITANKGPVVHAYHELTSLALSKGKYFYFESAVMDGAPIFSLFRETLPVARLIRFRGILNSTTNMILTEMEKGKSFEQAVAYCQEIGIAETDPSGDIDGWDAAVKVAALSTVLMNQPVKPDDIDREGIRDISPEKIIESQQLGKRWKLVCSAEMEGQYIKASVGPEMVGPESPFYGVNGTTSIIQFETDVLGKLSIVEENPGPHTTAYGLLADFLNAVSK